MRNSAAEAIEEVEATGRPHSFAVMSSRERRMLHLLLSESGLPTASSGEDPGRFVVLYPSAGADERARLELGQAQRTHDADAVRRAFRPR